MTRELELVEGGNDDGRSPIARMKLDRYCPHNHAVVDRHARRVNCDDCKAELDPIDVLENLAQAIDTYHASRDRAKRESKRELERLEDLKRQVRNAQAQLRRAQR